MRRGISVSRPWERGRPRRRNEREVRTALSRKPQELAVCLLLRAGAPAVPVFSSFVQTRGLRRRRWMEND